MKDDYAGLNARIIEERPSAGNEALFHYPGKRPVDGVIVKVEPNGSPAWFGLFSRGETSYSELVVDAECSTVVVVSFGAGYVVPVCSPGQYWTLPSSFIVGMLVVNTGKLLMVAWTPWNMFAFDCKQRVWDCPLASDGIKDVQVREDQIQGLAYLPERADYVAFTIRTHDGQFTFREAPPRGS